MVASQNLRFSPYQEFPAEALKAGFRHGAKGAHTSRTIMYADLAAVFSAAHQNASRDDYLSAITEGNCLGKPTASTRRLSAQRLSELYALDPEVSIFRVFRTLWGQEPGAGKLLAILCALARDPLLASTAESVLSLSPGSEFLREPAKRALRLHVRERLNEAILEKVVRNAASSWTQSGHLEGRTFKKRRLVQPGPIAATYALFLAYTAGFRGAEIFSSAWFAAIDCIPPKARELALDAKRHGFIDLRMSGDVVELNLGRLDPKTR